MDGARLHTCSCIQGSIRLLEKDHRVSARYTHKKTFSSLNKEHDFSRHKSILQNNIVSNNLTGVYHIDCTTKVAYSQRNFRILIFVDAIWRTNCSDWSFYCRIADLKVLSLSKTIQLMPLSFISWKSKSLMLFTFIWGINIDGLKIACIAFFNPGRLMAWLTEYFDKLIDSDAMNNDNVTPIRSCPRPL